MQPGRRGSCADLQDTGVTHVLLLGVAAGFEHCSASVSALAFDAEGERVAALSVVTATAASSKSAGDAAGPATAVLRVWSLDLGFRQRLQQLRGPVQLEPVVCKSVRQLAIGQIQLAMHDVCASGHAVTLGGRMYKSLCRLHLDVAGMQVPIPSSSGSTVSASPAMDLGYMVKWEPSGRVLAVAHRGKVLTMQAC